VDEVDKGGCRMDREHASIGIISEMVAPISLGEIGCGTRWLAFNTCQVKRDSMLGL
jgi:hypothetical protein